MFNFKFQTEANVVSIDSALLAAATKLHVDQTKVGCSTMNGSSTAKRDEILDELTSGSAVNMVPEDRKDCTEHAANNYVGRNARTSNT